jgi:hypothetical protein
VRRWPGIGQAPCFRRPQSHSLQVCLFKRELDGELQTKSVPSARHVLPFSSSSQASSCRSLQGQPATHTIIPSVRPRSPQSNARRHIRPSCRGPSVKSSQLTAPFCCGARIGANLENPPRPFWNGPFPLLTPPSTTTLFIQRHDDLSYLDIGEPSQTTR